MNRTIKTRSITKDIKTFNKRGTISTALKDTSIKGREFAESQAAPSTAKEQSNKAYAEQKTEQVAQKSTSATARKAMGQVQSIHKRTKRARTLSKDAAQDTARKVSTATKETVSRSIRKAPKSTIKSSDRTVKTAKVAAKTSVKTSHSAAHAVKVTAQATQRQAHTARSASKASRLFKRPRQAVTKFARMAIAAARSLWLALAALLGSASAIIVIICLVGLIAVSAFGIFFLGGDLGDGNLSLREVVDEINDEHTAHINEIKAQNPHDELALIGNKTPWKEVLALYSVKVTTDPDNPLDVVTLDAKRQQILRDVFWEMNAIDNRLESHDKTEIELIDDGSGNLIESNKTVTVEILYITLSNKSVDDMASQYLFSVKQIDLLHELLDKRYDSAWQSVLYGIKSGSGDIVEIAASQIGNVGGAPYWSWYGFPGRVEWCACFVSWCANEAGYLKAGIIPKFSYCPTGADWFKSSGLWQGRGYQPQPGDIIFFDWENDGVSDHVGIVESCDGSTVRTIEGNSGDACNRRNYSINGSSIYGYGTPMYR